MGRWIEHRVWLLSEWMDRHARLLEQINFVAWVLIWIGVALFVWLFFAFPLYDILRRVE